MLIPDERIYGEVGRHIGMQELESDYSPEAGRVVQAALETENVLGSFIAREKGLPDGYIHNPEFNPFELMTDEEKNNADFANEAMLSDSEEELNSLRRQHEKERNNREILSQAGALGAVATFGAAVADPINLIPIGGAAYRTYKTGDSILTGAMVTASVAAGTAGVAEAGLHATQLQRTYQESALNMTASFLLGGVLGAGASHLSNRKLLKDVTDTMDVEGRIARGEPTVTTDPEIEKAFGGDSAGAASALQDVQITGKVAKGLARTFGWDPLSRSLVSPNPYTRSLAAKIAENPYLMDGENLRAVESVIKVKTSEAYNRGFEVHLDAYREFRKAGNKLSRKKFNEFVSREQRNPGSVEDIHVQRAAKSWEENTYNPLRNEAIEAKLLAEDVHVDTAAQYLNRQWNPEKIAAKFDLFVDKMAVHLRAEAANTGRVVDESDITELARQIGQRLRTQNDGMLPYDYKIGEEVTKMSRTRGPKKTLSGVFKERSLNVKDADFEEFLENDIELLARNYIRRVVPDVEFVRAFDGDIAMETQIKQINDWYDDAIKRAPTENARLALKKKNTADVRDVKAMNERIRGIYQGGSSIVDPDSLFARGMRVARDLNYMRFMGGVVPASLSDVSRILMAEGITKTLTQGLVPLVRNIKGFKVAAHEAKMWGIGDEMISGNRVDVLADIADYSRGQTAVERGIHSFAQGFSNINLMNQWNTGMKQLQSVVMQNQIVPNMIMGRVDGRLTRLGIPEADQLNIGRELQKHGKKVDGFWLANVSKWDSPELALMYKTAIRKESDRVIVVPGQERPLFMSTEMGKTIFQFRSFMMAATQRVLIAALQKQDAHLLSSLIMMTSFGMMTYAFKQWDAGRPLSDDPAVWVLEGIDRSGSTGIIMEINNSVEKVFPRVGLRNLVGIKAPSSRFASRDAAETMLGPTFGSLLSTTLRVANATTGEREWNDSDTRALRRLLPYQNLFILRQGIDRLEDQL